MNENRRQILQMLSEGKINSDEAERLIAALENAPPAGATAPSPRPAPKYIRLLVESDKSGDGDNAKKVNIRVPLALLRAGVKFSTLMPPQARTRVNEALREKGMEFDITQMKPENLEALIANLQDVSIDIEQKKGTEKVRIFCE